jgi:hypothetical protein
MIMFFFIAKTKRGSRGRRARNTYFGGRPRVSRGGDGWEHSDALLEEALHIFFFFSAVATSGRCPAAGCRLAPPKAAPISVSPGIRSAPGGQDGWLSGFDS